MSVNRDGVEFAKLTGSECRHPRSAQLGQRHHTMPRRFSLMPDFLPFPLRCHLGPETSQIINYSRIRCSSTSIVPRGSRSSSSGPSTQQGTVGNMNYLTPSSSKSPLPRETECDRSLMSVATSTSSGSSATLCRICYSDGTDEELISPCQCLGSVAPIHKSCLERWLSSSSTDCCDLCQYKFPVKKIPKSFCEYLTEERHIWRPFLGDTCCLLILFPMICITTYLCIAGAIEFLNRDLEKAPLKILFKANGSVFSVENRSKYPSNLVWKTKDNGNKNKDYVYKWEAYGLVIIASLLLAIFIIWASLSIRFYVRAWMIWRVKHCKVVLVETEVARYLSLPSPILPLRPLPGEANQESLPYCTTPLPVHNLTSVTSPESIVPTPPPLMQCTQENSTCGNSLTSIVSHHEASRFANLGIVQSASNHAVDSESNLKAISSASGSEEQSHMGSAPSESPGSNIHDVVPLPRLIPAFLQTTSKQGTHLSSPVLSTTSSHKPFLTEIDTHFSPCPLHKEELESTKI